MRQPKKTPAKSASGSGTLHGKRGLKTSSGSGRLHARGRTPSGRASGSGTLHGRTKTGTASGSGTLKAPAPKKTPKKPKPRKWSPGADVACCSAEALGWLLGWDHAAVLDLYWRTCSDPDEGASILDTLLAAQVPSLEPVDRSAVSAAAKRADPAPHGLILGVSLPEPHAVAVTPDGTWWSWGEPFNPAGWPGLVIDEAWAVLL